MVIFLQHVFIKTVTFHTDIIMVSKKDFISKKKYI
jgi:hypothetical protein